MLFCPDYNSPTGPNGVPELCPTPGNPAAYFTEIIVNGNLIIPPQKPPKQHIVKVTHTIKLKDIEVITVTSPTGVVLGNKILVAGTITLFIQYVADVPDQKVHSVHYDLPFTALILDDCGNPISPTAPIFPDNFVVHVCVEKIRIDQIDSRTLSKQIVLMVWAEQNP